MKGLKLYLVISGIFMVAYVVAQYYKPKPTDWSPSYLKEDKIPFGTFILHQEIGSLFPNSTIRVSRQPVYNTLKGTDYEQSNYLIIAGTLNFSKYDYQEMEHYLRRGNNVFIAAFELGKMLNDTLNIRTTTLFNMGKSASAGINFVNPVLKANRNYVFDKGLGDQYFDVAEAKNVTVLGKNQYGNPNYVRYSFGKGNLYLLPNPQLLANYSLINLRGAEYAAKTLSYLNKSKLLIWDESNTRGNIDDASILRVLFNHPPLKWAYLIALISLLIFVGFEIKRRQRIIPVIEPLLNSSVDFVKVMGKVYYQQRDNNDLAKKKISYWLEFIRSNYRLKTNELNTEFLNNLIHKSGGDEETIAALIATINQINGGVKVDDNQLISLNKLIEKFYKQVQ
ncbi:hypothetical protein ACVWYN_000640 [Pedobacter sp. UYP24]